MNDLAAITLAVGLAAFVPSIALTLWLVLRFIRAAISRRRWRRRNPILGPNERLVECDTRRLMIGDDMVLHVRIPPEVKV